MFFSSIKNLGSNLVNQDYNRTTFLRNPEQDERIFKIEQIFSCPEIRDLYLRAEAVPIFRSNLPKKWKIVFFQEGEYPSAASCNYPKREIDIRENLTDNEKISNFVFELINATYQDRFEELYQKACLREIECEEYAKEMERIEHEGGLLHSKIMKAAIKRMGWEDNDRSLDSGGCIPLDFNRFWNAIKFTSHAQYYRNNYAKMHTPPINNDFFKQNLFNGCGEPSLHLFNIVRAALRFDVHYLRRLFDLIGYS